MKLHTALLLAAATSALTPLVVGCEGQAPATTAAPTASANTAPAATSTASVAEPAPRRRDGTWGVDAPGRGRAYDIASKGGVTTLNMGGTVFEGKDDPKGRRYTTSSGGSYLLENKGDDLEIAVDGKPTWRVSFDGDDLKIASKDTTYTITKVGDSFEVKEGDKLIGKVVVEGEQVLVQDSSGKTEYQGKDGLVAGWGVLILEDIHPIAERIILTELLARG